MKNLKYIKVAAIIVLMLLIGANVSAKKVKGSGNIIKQNRAVETFSEIYCNGIVNVYLTQGDKEAVVVESHDNFQKYILTEVSGGVLKVKTQDKIKFESNPKIDIHITIVNIAKLDNNGIGNVKCVTELKLEQLKIVNSGVGNIKMLGTVNELEIKNNGVGNIKAFDFVGQKVDINNNGVGNVRVYAVSEIKIVNNGVGSIDYKGDAKIVDIDSNGIGGIHKK